MLNSETDYQKTYIELINELVVLQDKINRHLVEIYTDEDRDTVLPVYVDIRNEIKRVREVSMGIEDIHNTHDNEYLKHLR